MQKEKRCLIAQEATVSHRVHRPRMQPEGAAALWCGTRATPASQASLSFQRETSSHSLGSDWDSGSTCSCAIWGDSLPETAVKIANGCHLSSLLTFCMAYTADLAAQNKKSSYVSHEMGALQSRCLQMSLCNCHSSFFTLIASWLEVRRHRTVIVTVHSCMFASPQAESSRTS